MNGIKQNWYDFPVTMIAEWFGVGRIRPSGTMGTIAALPILWGVGFAFGIEGIYVFTALSIIIGSFCIFFYQQKRQSHDAKEIVIDEVAGMGVTLCFLPLDFTSLAIGFVLFRLFDITKPYPINLIDHRMNNAFGVMFDDLVAGVYAGLFSLGILALLEMQPM